MVSSSIVQCLVGQQVSSQKCKNSKLLSIFAAKDSYTDTFEVQSMIGWAVEHCYIDVLQSEGNTVNSKTYFQEETLKYGTFGYYFIGRNYETNQFYEYHFENLETAMNSFEILSDKGIVGELFQTKNEEGTTTQKTVIRTDVNSLKSQMKLTSVELSSPTHSGKNEAYATISMYLQQYKRLFTYPVYQPSDADLQIY